MLADWFTIVAQAINFLILVWLMKRFLYKPVVDAIDAREKRIATELANADAKKAEAQKEHEEFQHKNVEFDQQRAALLTKATEEAQAERQRLLGEARQAAIDLSLKQQEALRNEEQTLHEAIRRRTQDEVFAIARKALTDLATTSLEERLGEVFTRRLREMDGKAKEGLGVALKIASAPAVVRSTFDLPAEQRAAIQNALNETFSAEVRVRFETAPDLVSGIELTTNGQKVGWSIADYLASLERGVDELLKQKDKPEEPKPAEPKPAEPKPEEAKAEEPRAEPKPDEPKPEKPKPEEPKPAEPKPAEPKPAEPKPEEAKAEEPKAEPKPDEPKPEKPKPEEPKPEETKAKEPKAEEPKPEAPKPAEPKPEEPKPEEPKPRGT
jgi:F-type H+-transporting ATPase subunit b